jgi:hypothetical protein
VVTRFPSQGQIYDQAVPLFEAAGKGARLVVNQAALKVKSAVVQPLFDAFARAVS